MQLDFATKSTVKSEIDISSVQLPPQNLEFAFIKIEDTKDFNAPDALPPIPCFQPEVDLLRITLTKNDNLAMWREFFYRIWN